MGNKIKYNLIVNYYKDKNSERAKELDFCFVTNLENEYINNVIVICTEYDLGIIKNILSDKKHLLDKITPIISNIRPSFNDYFRLLSKLFSSDDNINIISNLDIIIPKETLTYSPYYITSKKCCLALSRWDMTNSDFSNSVHFDRPDSQDTWIFKGDIPQLTGASFGLGLAGCDNKILYLLEEVGYNISNPSKTLKTYHFHLTDIRNYTNIVGQAIERIPPPYKLIHPTI